MTYYILRHPYYTDTAYVIRKRGNRYYFYLAKNHNTNFRWKLDKIPVPGLCRWQTFREAGWTKKAISKEDVLILAL